MPDKPAHWYALAGLVIVLDQLSKWVVLNHVQFGETIYVAPFWNWVLTFNPGAAFSFLADQPGWQRWFFTVLALGVSAWMAAEIRRQFNGYRRAGNVDDFSECLHRNLLYFCRFLSYTAQANALVSPSP